MVLVVKNLPANAGRCERHWFDPWFGEIPWRRVWQPTPIFLPGESHGQRSLAGYSPEGCKVSDTTEVSEHACTQEIISQGQYLGLFQGKKGLPW